jgi:hypothetical protein
MKFELVFVALPISAIVAPSAFAVQYLSVDQAQKAIFPGKSFTAAPVKLTAGQRKAIEQASGVRVLKDEQPVWRVGAGGWFIVDEVVGKHEFITYAVGLNSDGSVKQIEIIRGSTRKVPLFRVPTRQLMRAVTALNFRLRINPGCSIFIVPLWSFPLADFLLWPIPQN